MEYRKINNTDLELSSIALGCWQFSGDEMWGSQEDRDSVDAVHAALDSGVNFFDTAEVYGDGKSEEVLGTALMGKRDRAIVATKSWGPTYGSVELVESCEKSLKRLQSDHIDIYQIHWPRPEAAPVDHIFEGVRRLKESGKIRYFGVCNYGVKDMSELLTSGEFVTNQLCYSLLWRGIEYEILPLCEKKGIGIFTYSTLVHGLLSGKYVKLDEFPKPRARSMHFSSQRPGVRHGQSGQEVLTEKSLSKIRGLCDEAGVSMFEAAFGWAIHRPQITSVIAGARNREQALGNAGIADIKFPDGFLASLTDATDDLKKAFGNQVDPWEYPGRIR